MRTVSSFFGACTYVKRTEAGISGEDSFMNRHASRIPRGLIARDAEKHTGHFSHRLHSQHDVAIQHLLDRPFYTEGKKTRIEGTRT